MKVDAQLGKELPPARSPSEWTSSTLPAPASRRTDTIRQNGDAPVSARAFKQEFPGTTTELAKRFAVSAVPLNSREQLRMQGIVSSSPPDCRRLVGHLAEPTCEVHKAVRQRIRLSPPHSSEPLVAILAFVPRQDGDEVDTDWLAIRPLRLCF